MTKKTSKAKTASTAQKQTTEPENTQTPAQNQETQLNIFDLSILTKAVESAAKKEAFNDLELLQIKPSYDRLVKFLNQYATSLKEEPK